MDQARVTLRKLANKQQTNEKRLGNASGGFFKEEEEVEEVEEENRRSATGNQGSAIMQMSHPSAATGRRNISRYANEAIEIQPGPTRVARFSENARKSDAGNMQIRVRAMASTSRNHPKINVSTFNKKEKRGGERRKNGGEKYVKIK